MISCLKPFYIQYANSHPLLADNLSTNYQQFRRHLCGVKRSSYLSGNLPFHYSDYTLYIMTTPLLGPAILISSKNNMAPSEAIKTDDRR